jgi:hypothetical protein
MNRQDYAAWERRVQDRADLLWRAAGSPDGPRNIFIEEARELLALEEVEPPTLDPRRAARPVVEEAAIQENLGEFPTLTDQGEEETYPHRHHLDDGPRLSDGDASEEGGVLPDEDSPDPDLPDITSADADVTASALQAEDDPPNDDLNDDGLPDPVDLDEEVEGEMPPGDEYEDAAPPRDEADDR